MGSAVSEQQIDWNKEHGNFPWRRIAIVSLALIAAVVVVVFLVVFPQFRPVEGGSGTPAHETASVATGLIPDPPKKLEEKLISTTALDLWSEYDANEVLADRKYKGRLLSITGSISS